LVSEESRFKHEARNSPSIPTTIEAKEVPFILGNEDLLIQLFLNLLANAYDAMKESREKRAAIKAYALSEDPSFVQVEVQDTGCGISAALKDKVWEYLFTTKTHQGGSGIGLFWCKTIVENIHKGKIWFESKEDEGTTFFVKLPVWKEPDQGNLTT
jgi:signal transduction histidine kinase